VPAQVSVKLVVVVSGPVEALPLVIWVPVHPPEAVQLVALVELHVSVEEPPLATLGILALSVSVGVGPPATRSPAAQAHRLAPRRMGRIVGFKGVR
jgi:hypothetical protein